MAAALTLNNRWGHASNDPIVTLPQSDRIEYRGIEGTLDALDAHVSSPSRPTRTKGGANAN